MLNDPGEQIPRDQWDRPMILPPPGVEPERTTGKWAGYTPYSRASSFGQTIEDITNLVTWQKRQVARGMGLLYERRKLSLGPTGGLPADPALEPGDKMSKDAWNAMAARAESEVGSYAKADIGTAIHFGTELVDKGQSLDQLTPLVRERATSYWHFCREYNIVPTSIEVFGVDDEHRVAGTWDRTGWFLGRHGILDVKTSSTMDFAGIGFAVQLATYAHAQRYFPNGQRVPHEVMDLDRAWIIHVDREQGGPITLHPVDIAVGWKYAQLVNEVKAARKVGTQAIGDFPTDEATRAICRATTKAELRAVFAAGPLEQHHRDLAADLAGRLP